MTSKRVLIVDQLNMFFRAYIVDPSLSSNGQPIGGLKGSIKILQKLVRESNPDRVVICWDGQGGSKKRKLANKDYKSGRKPIRLNRDIRNLTENEEIENKVWQQTRLVDYFNQMPISQIMIQDIEADDVIAYACQMPSLKSWHKIIVSSDKDFYQLLDNSTVLHRPIQKETLNKKDIISKFGIHPNNFTLARAMAGDKSDALPGIGGVGLPTVAKRFPFLSEEKSFSLDDVVDYAKEASQTSNLKAFNMLLENEKTFRDNYKIMQLYAPSMSVSAKKTVRDSIELHDRSFNKTEIRKMMIQDGFGEYNWSSLFQNLNRMSLDK